MMMQTPKCYNIVLVEPPGFEHTPVFAEVARLLDASLRSLGHQTEIRLNQFRDDTINIILGYQMVLMTEELKQAPFIIYQLEQLSPTDERFKGEWLNLLRMASD